MLLLAYEQAYATLTIGNAKLLKSGINVAEHQRKHATANATALKKRHLTPRQLSQFKKVGNNTVYESSLQFAFPGSLDAYGNTEKFRILEAGNRVIKVSALSCELMLYFNRKTSGEVDCSATFGSYDKLKMNSKVALTIDASSGEAGRTVISRCSQDRSDECDEPIFTGTKLLDIRSIVMPCINQDATIDSTSGDLVIYTYESVYDPLYSTTGFQLEQNQVLSMAMMVDAASYGGRAGKLFTATGWCTYSASV